MPMRRIWGVVMAMLVCAGAQAERPEPDDFAFGLRVDPRGDQALWRVELPERVYRKITRTDLGDVRVFNVTGDPVPFTLRRPERPDADAPEPIAVPFFALPAVQEGESVSGSVRIVTDDDGTVVDVAPKDGSDSASRAGAYLIDLTGLEQPVTGLRLTWKRADADGFTATVDVARSEDLTRWRTIAHGASLADLSSGGHTLRRREIGWRTRETRYVRVEWPQALSEISLTGVEALFPDERAQLPRRWVEAAGARVPDEEGIYDFNAGGYFPIDRARLRFTAENFVVEGRLLSRAGPEARWRNRHRGVFYHLRKGEVTLDSEPVVLAPSAHRDWRLEARGAPTGTPRLELGWVPHTLTFVAQGRGPYTVAYGNATAEPPKRRADALLQDLDEDRKTSLVGEARVAESVVLGGADRLRPPPEPLPWRTWLLWAVLALGVTVLAFMVRRLYRQMSEAGSPD